MLLVSAGYDLFLTICRIVKTWFARIVAPPICAYCATFLSHKAIFCSYCIAAITPVVSKTIVVTKKYQVPVLSVGEYADPLKCLVLAKGWSDIVASHELGQLVAEYVSHSVIQCDYIVPVPLHWTRYAWRGYNQADIMARILAKQMGVPVVQLVRRVRATPLQSSVSHLEREQNVSNSFQLVHTFFKGDLSRYKSKRLLIVDDVMTTGATIRSVAKVLAQLRPESLMGIVAARVK